MESLCVLCALGGEESWLRREAALWNYPSTIVLSAQFPSNEFGGCCWKRVETRFNVFVRGMPARNSFAGRWQPHTGNHDSSLSETNKKR
jgi:hypothetical protein